MQNTTAMCGNRIALFDNVSEDEGEVFAQSEELPSLVEDVVEENGGKPCTNELFDELTMSEHVNPHDFSFLLIF